MFSKSCKYAIRSVLYLAVNTDENTKLGVEELASELDVPKHFLAKILQQLTKQRKISSTKGRNGGFFLSRQNKEAGLLSIIETIDGVGALKGCILGLNHCSSKNPCPYHHSIQSYRDTLYGQFQNETIEATAQRIMEQDLKLKNEL